MKKNNEKKQRKKTIILYFLRKMKNFVAETSLKPIDQ